MSRLLRQKKKAMDGFLEPTDWYTGNLTGLPSASIDHQRSGQHGISWGRRNAVGAAIAVEILIVRPMNRNLSRLEPNVLQALVVAKIALTIGLRNQD